MTITRSGYGYIAITLLMGFAAVNTGNNLLFLVVSSLLGFMAVSGFAGWLNIRENRVDLDFPDEIYAGKKVFVTVRLENRKKRMPSFLLKLDAFGESLRFPLVEKSSEDTGSLCVTFPERGAVVPEKVVLSSPFPINFFIRINTIHLDSRCTVFPAPRECALPDGPGRKDARGEALSSRKGYGGDIARIRDYVTSDPVKHIHWRLSARHEDLKVKELTAPAEAPLVVDIYALPGATLEDNLSYGTFLINKAARAGRPVGLRLGRLFLRPDSARAHRLHLLTELAMYGRN
ncbi:MAG: DUF58 domain-containing protein [Geobacteraceae bacterium]